RPLALGIKRGLAPRAENIEPFRALAMLAGIRCMIMDAEGAAVDLRGPHHDKLLQQRFQTIVLNRLSEVDPRLHRGGTGGEGVQSGCHRHLLPGVLGGMTRGNCGIRQGAEFFLSPHPTNCSRSCPGTIPETRKPALNGAETWSARCWRRASTPDA